MNYYNDCISFIGHLSPDMIQFIFSSIHGEHNPYYIYAIIGADPWSVLGHVKSGPIKIVSRSSWLWWKTKIYIITPMIYIDTPVQYSSIDMDLVYVGTVDQGGPNI